MFTIKQIHMDGSETLEPVDSVQYTPAHERSGLQNQSGTPATVWGDGKPFTGGTIFVMNSLGKTVARYDLGASPVPIVGDGLTDPRPRAVVGDPATVRQI